MYQFLYGFPNAYAYNKIDNIDKTKWRYVRKCLCIKSVILIASWNNSILVDF